MSFYTDEQLSMILSANGACHYYDGIINSEYWHHPDPKRNEVIVEKAEAVASKVYEWLHLVGCLDGFTGPDVLLRHLERNGLA